MEPQNGLLGDRYTGARQSKSMINWIVTRLVQIRNVYTPVEFPIEYIDFEIDWKFRNCRHKSEAKSSSINEGIETCKQWWSKLLNGISEYKQTFEGTADGVSPGMRTPESTFQLHVPSSRAMGNGEGTYNNSR